MILYKKHTKKEIFLAIVAKNQNAIAMPVVADS
jgi:hypothetical protein